ncbi:lipase member K-like [Diorhabda carinulata]|uniref:lipase member K-like n=1 Tax=Diorhabda carinulata TaxID=1163345 RepID=UPI0025A0EE78|nr:lipase member K-like [Diorhabda carinulata]
MRIARIFFIGEILLIAYANDNNVCPTFKDYYTMKNNSNCWYDLAAEYSAPEIIRLMGYPVSVYTVQTADGYLLTMFRIPNYKNENSKTRKHPVYLQHGIVATCASFLGNGKNSLAFVLADAGYDVWLGNYRGTAYSEGHINLTVYDQEYWDHSMDEIALLDLPANFNTILEHSPPDSKIIYIGHSLGTSLSLMYSAEYPEMSKKVIKMMILLCPAYTLTHMVSPYRILAPIGDFILDFIKRLRLDRIVSQAEEQKRLIVPPCTESPEMMQNCMQWYNLFYGRNTDLGPETIPVYFNQLPGGTSIKVVNHAANLVLGYFRKYNYKKFNNKLYGRDHPPEYDIKKVKVPVYLVYTTQDWATPEADALNLWRNLPEESRYGKLKIDRKAFNHIDMVYGRHARQWVYDPLIQILNKFIKS